MKADVEIDGIVASAADIKLIVGRFVRRQGQFGTVAVVAYHTSSGVEIISDPKRLFGRDGTVETHWIGQHTGLNPGDWVEFDVVRNTRPRAPEWKASHLRRMPRFAVLPQATIPSYRALLTREGWRGDARPGLWAFRLAGDLVLVAEMELTKDKGLRIKTTSARELNCYEFLDESVVSLSAGSGAEAVFITPESGPTTMFDWSDEADYIGRVVRSLAGASDPRVAEIITWLELHHEEGTGRVSAASGDTRPALDALRSGALAARLQADRELMEVYLAAALKDDGVRDAVAAFAKEGHGAEWERLQANLAEEISADRARRLEELSTEMDAERTLAAASLATKMDELEVEGRASLTGRLERAEYEAAERIKALEKRHSERAGEMDRDIDELTKKLTATRLEITEAEAERGSLEAQAENVRAQLDETKREVDRLLAIAQRLGPADQIGNAPAPAPRPGGIARVFPDHPKVDAASKGALISRQVMLSEGGRQSLQSLIVLLMAGEVPVLTGPGTADLLRVAEAVVCPGRLVSIEADPTLISVDDLWARPGSGVPTLLASAAGAAQEGGAVLVVIRGIERSGARFWLPALSDALRDGGLPRGLFVCCTVHGRDHDEVAALPAGIPWLKAVEIIKPGAQSAGPSLLTHPRIDLETMDPGPMPTDLSSANSIVLELGADLSLDLAMRAARMFAEATTLLGNEESASRLVINLAKPLADKTSN